MIIKVIGDYEIYVDGNRDHEARFDTHKTTIQKNKDGEEKEVTVYKSIGHFINVKNACTAIYQDMCIKKAEKKDKITLKEWIDIQKETLDEISAVMSKVEP